MSKKKILFCFTFAGGTASFFNQIEEFIDTNIKVVKLEYAGHGSRHREPLGDDFEEVTHDLYNKILQIMQDEVVGKNFLEYSLLGYSMGSISVIEMLRVISCKKHFPMPVHVFIAAHIPKSKHILQNVNSLECDDYVKQRTIEFGGIPDNLVNNRSFWRVYLPIYKADYTMIAKYDFDNLNYKTEVPASIFYSETDTKYEDMILWKKYFVGNCEFIEYEGSHFFIKDHYAEMAAVINSRMEFKV